MVADMITYRERVMKDRLSDQSHPMSQTPPPLPHRSIAGQYECGLVEDRTERTQRQNQAKIINKEDPMSHRIIEKRRRDRMNNCLADLSRLIPAEYMKKGRGRVEKTEIIEMAIKHMKYLQSNVSSSVGYQQRGTKLPEPVETEQLQAPSPEQTEKSASIAEQYKMGFFECLTETMQYLVEGHGYPPGHGLCLSLINHLQNHCAQIIKGKQVIRDVVKDEIILEVNRFNANMVMNHDEDGDGSCEETSQRKNSSKNSKSESSISLCTSNEQTLPDRCNMSFTADSSYSSNGSMYKFKTDIKQRFSAENGGGGGGGVGSVVGGDGGGGGGGDGGGGGNPLDHPMMMMTADFYDAPDCGDGSTSSNKKAKKRRRNESSDCCLAAAEDCRQEVPIFALHANGSYYVPLTVNREIISPMLDAMLSENRSPVIVHPISISVDFQATANQL